MSPKPLEVSLCSRECKETKRDNAWKSDPFVVLGCHICHDYVTSPSFVRTKSWLFSTVVWLLGKELGKEPAKELGFVVTKARVALLRKKPLRGITWFPCIYIYIVFQTSNVWCICNWCENLATTRSAQESTWQSVCLVLGVDSADMVTEAVAINRPFSRLDMSKCQSEQSMLLVDGKEAKTESVEICWKVQIE